VESAHWLLAHAAVVGVVQAPVPSHVDAVVAAPPAHVPAAH
jgi:hypothetical protein